MKIAAITAITATWLCGSWTLMLGVGIAHLHWWHQIPVMGFPTALVLSLLSMAPVLLTFVISAFASGH